MLHARKCDVPCYMPVRAWEAQSAGNPAAKRGLRSVTALAVIIPLTAKTGFHCSSHGSEASRSHLDVQVVLSR